MDILDLIGISKLSNSEIATPQKVVDEMVALLPDEIFKPETTFLDPACKSGRYLISLKNRLMNSTKMIKAIPDEKKRLKHILKNQLYGLSTSTTTALITTRALYGKLVLNGNVTYIDNYLQRMADKNINYKDLIKEAFGLNMTFDVVIGNPPYNDSTGGGGEENKQSSKPLHTEFVDMAIASLYARYVSFVMPCRWYVENDKQNKRTREQILSRHLRILHDFSNCTDIFCNVNIAGGVCYFLYDREYDGETNVILHTNKIIDININFDSSKVFYRSKEMMSIIDKIHIKDSKYISKKVCTTAPFGFKRAYRGSVISNGDYNIKLISANNDESYVSLSEVTKNKDLIPKYKVCTGYMQSSSGNVINPAWILQPQEVCTLTYMVIDYYDTFEQANNCKAYLKTKFVRALIKITQTKSSFTKENFDLVPLQDFTASSDIDWSQSIIEIDKQLYKKYNLTQEEINYIESTIKPMN